MPVRGVSLCVSCSCTVAEDPSRHSHGTCHLLTFVTVLTGELTAVRPVFMRPTALLKEAKLRACSRFQRKCSGYPRPSPPLPLRSFLLVTQNLHVGELCSSTTAPASP